MEKSSINPSQKKNGICIKSLEIIRPQFNSSQYQKHKLVFIIDNETNLLQKKWIKQISNKYSTTIFQDWKTQLATKVEQCECSNRENIYCIIEIQQINIERTEIESWAQGSCLGQRQPDLQIQRDKSLLRLSPQQLNRSVPHRKQEYVTAEPMIILSYLNKIIIYSAMIKKIARLNIDGLININTQYEITKALSLIEKKKKFGALAVVINSTGGSLRSAKMIASLLKNYRDEKQIPIYCFSKDFCLNSANILLSLGTKVYVHKFSVIGNFAYISQHIKDHQLFEKYKFGSQPITKMEHNYIKFGLLEVDVQNERLDKLFLNQNEKQLKQTVFQDRIQEIKLKQKNITDFQQKIFNKPIIQPTEAVEYGLVDQVVGCDQFLNTNFPDAQVYDFNTPIFENTTMNWLYELLVYFKGQKKGNK